jgi:hypothetical protein
MRPNRNPASFALRSRRVWRPRELPEYNGSTEMVRQIEGEMTTLVCLVGVDQRKPSSVYIGSDSRISWGDSDTVWSQGRKVFACANSPRVFGYVGDVTFPALAIPTIVDLIDKGAVDPNATEEDSCRSSSCCGRTIHDNSAGTVGSFRPIGRAKDFAASSRWTYSHTQLPATSGTLRSWKCHRCHRHLRSWAPAAEACGRRALIGRRVPRRTLPAPSSRRCATQSPAAKTH